MPTTPESSARAHIRRESLDIYNRLHSVNTDIAFVDEVCTAYPLFPLIRTAPCTSCSTPHLTKFHGQQTSAAGPGIPTLILYIPLLHMTPSDNVVCRHILRRTRTSRAPMVITETGPSTSAARISTYYPLQPLTAGTSTMTLLYLSSKK